MKRSTFMLITAAIGVLSGIGMLVSPQAVLATYGVSLDPVAALLGRDVGAFLLVVGVLNAIARNAPDSTAMRAILVANFVSHFVPFVLDFHNTVSGLVDAHGWTSVTQHALFSAGFAYYLAETRRPQGARTA